MSRRTCGTDRARSKGAIKRAHPDLNQGPADLQSAALTTELCTQCLHSEKQVDYSFGASLFRAMMENYKDFGLSRFLHEKLESRAEQHKESVCFTIGTRASVYLQKGMYRRIWAYTARHQWSSGYDVSLTR